MSDFKHGNKWMKTNLRQKQKEYTRGEILASAKALFRQSGYDGTTTRQIADAAGVGIGTVFAHFPDKHSLLQELLLRDIDQVLAMARSELEENAGWLDAALHYARHLYAYHCGQRELSRVLLKEAIFSYSYYAEQLGAFQRELSARMQTGFPGMDESDRNGLAEILLANYFMVLIQGLSMPDSTAEEWLEQLEARCSLLARMKLKKK